MCNSRIFLIIGVMSIFSLENVLIISISFSSEIEDFGKNDLSLFIILFRFDCC